MGYQESFIKMEKSNDFDKLYKYIVKKGLSCFEGSALPVEVITLIKPVTYNDEECQITFEVGERFIYIVGERSSQRSSYAFFEDCGEDVPTLFLENLCIFFEDWLPTAEIFESEELATHEEFEW